MSWLRISLCSATIAEILTWKQVQNGMWEYAEDLFTDNSESRGPQSFILHRESDGPCLMMDKVYVSDCPLFVTMLHSMRIFLDIGWGSISFLHVLDGSKSLHWLYFHLRGHRAYYFCFLNSTNDDHSVLHIYPMMKPGAASSLAILGTTHKSPLYEAWTGNSLVLRILKFLLGANIIKKEFQINMGRRSKMAIRVGNQKS
jgi:hypothetical protein